MQHQSVDQTCAPEVEDFERHLAQVQEEEHLCLLYRHIGETIGPTGAFLRLGLARDEQCLYITGDYAPDQIASLLTAAGVEVSRECARGALEIQRAYRPPQPGGFDPEGVLAFIREMAEQAVARGFAGLRVVADMTWTLREEADEAQLAWFEARWNDLVATAPVAVICQYQETRFTAETIGAELRTHPRVFLGDEICLNPYYEPPAASDVLPGVLSDVLSGVPPNGSAHVRWKLAHLRRLSQAEKERALLSREQAAREQAEATQRQMTRVLERIGDAFIAVDRQWRFVYVNPKAEQILGRARHELLAKTVHEVFSKVADSPVYQAMQRAAAEGQMVVVEEFSPILKAWLEVRAYPADDGVTVYFQDVTEHRRVKEALQQTLRRREDFMAILVHDLRNPLSTISGHAQLMMRQVRRADGADGFSSRMAERIESGLRPVLDAASRMQGMMDELLDIAQLDAGKPLPLKRTAVDLVMLARQVVEQRQTASERHRVRLEVPPAELVGEWDAPRLERVLDNLLSNAIKYSPAGGDIRVQVEREAAQAIVRVLDQGVGVPAADLPYVFERFHRAHNAQGRAVGTGLGLWGAQEIVRAHGGTLEATSAGEGQGATFTVRLPLSIGRDQAHRSGDGNTSGS